MSSRSSAGILAVAGLAGTGSMILELAAVRLIAPRFGTSSVVYPAAGLIESAITAGAKVLEINPEATPLSDRVEWSIRGKSGQVLPQLMNGAFGE